MGVSCAYPLSVRTVTVSDVAHSRSSSKPFQQFSLRRED